MKKRLEEQSDLDCLQKYPLPLLPTISVLILLCASGSGHPYVCAQSTLILQRKSAEHLQLCVVCVCVNTQPVISTWVARWTNLKTIFFLQNFEEVKPKQNTLWIYLQIPEQLTHLILKEEKEIKNNIWTIKGFKSMR